MNNTPIYFDIVDRPIIDKHSLEVGLSDGLSNCQFLISFVSTNYLDSIWCRGELREFIFLHGKKLSNPEIEYLRKNNSLSILSTDHQTHFELPKVPVIIVLLENKIVEGKFSKPVIDFSNTITPEQEFWGHRSNIQAWVECEYDTRLLHSNLSFPLLKALSDAGDPKAKAIFLA